MAVGHFYGLTIEKIFSGAIDFSTDTFYCSLHTATYAYDQDADEFFADVTDEITGTGYTAGGVVVSGLTMTYNAGDKAFYLDIDDPLWTGLTATGIKYGVIRKDTGDSATDPLIAILVLATADDVTAADYSLVIPTEGLFAVGVS